MPSYTQTAAKLVRPRCWVQFGLRTLLVAIFLACLLFAWMAYLSRSGRQQRAAARALQQRGASVQYDRRVDSDSPFPTSLPDGPIGAFADMFAPNVDDVFAEDKPLTDADLVNLRGLKHLDRLVLSGTKITDAGLEHLRHVPQLPNLWLSRTAITDAGLVHLKAVPRLEILLLDGTQITDSGLVHLRSLPRLRVLDLSRLDAAITPVADRLLKQFTQARKDRESAGGDDKAAIRDAIESIQGLRVTQGVVNYGPDDHQLHGGYNEWRVESGVFKFVRPLN